MAGQFDLVVASVHGRFSMDRASQTERIIRAVSNPYTTILGRMTGRQLLRRPGYEIDTEKVLAACAEHGVAVEINANPWRLDLDWRWHDIALKLGCLMSINPDARSTRELDLTHWGVAQRRGAEGESSQLPQRRRAGLLSGEEARPAGQARFASGREAPVAHSNFWRQKARRSAQASGSHQPLIF